ncbi:MAG: AAA family ATPase [Candidatus Heimdallarchaeota archaeon]
MSSTGKLYEYVSIYARRAVQADRAGKRKEAIIHYVRAIEILQKMINFTDNPDLKQMYYNKAKEYISRVKDLQKRPTRTVSRGRGEAKGEEDEEVGGLEQAIADTIITEKPEIKWEDVANLQTAKQALREAIIWPIMRPDLFQGARTPWKGILLFGPPGCGKTLLAKAVASECEATFFNVSAASIMSKWLGESERLVKTLFDQAREKQPSIVFFDEVDALTGARGTNEHDSVRRVKTQLMQAVDGILSKKTDRLVIIGATNLPQQLDIAMRRRFEKRVYVPLPEKEARAAVFRIHTKGVEINDSVDFDQLAEWTVGFSGADIALICREAIMVPLRELDESDLLKDATSKVRPVTKQDFLTSLQRIKPSVSPQELISYEDWQKQFAVE